MHCTHEQASLPVIFASNFFRGEQLSRNEVFGEEGKQNFLW